MTGKDIFQTWAPAGCKWTAWARPVPFIAINDGHKIKSAMNFTIPGVNYIDKAPNNTAIILDLPGYDGIKEGIALAMSGFRPIPLYNGTNGQKGAMALVDNRAVESALIWGASELEKLKIDKDAPPAFLLDSNRTHRFRLNGFVFDNSWDLYDQDIPSPEYFINNEIDKIIVRGETIQKDLIRILYKFQKQKITILFTNGYKDPKKVAIKKPFQLFQ
ncbi:MAG: hypothetical protein FWD23_09505 [Oscillospiraceae bacterium]|nr:hypothetical protein [Oscillospiraceae bacterium]